MSDVDIIQKREEDERLDTAEDPNEEVRYQSRALLPYHAFHKHCGPTMLMIKSSRFSLD